MVTNIIITAIITTIIVSLATYFFCKKRFYQTLPKWYGKWGIEIAEKIAQISPNAIYMLDREHRMREVLNYNPKEIPFSLQEIIGKLAYEYMDDENRKKIIQVIEQAFETDKTLNVNYSIIVDDNTTTYYEGCFKRVNSEWVICIAHDITQTYLYEQGLIQGKKKLEEAQKINQLILDNASCGLVYVDTNFVVQFENLHSISKEGFDREYKTGEHCYQRVKGRKTPCDNCLAQNAIRTKGIQKEELVINENLYFEVTATPVLDPDNNCLGVVLKYDNITTRQQVAQELQRAKETAEASDKLKSQFLSNMSHEIRTPLNAIIGFSDLLMTTKDEKTQAEYISIIKRNNELLLQLISDILDISRIEADKLEFVYKDVCINNLFRELEASIKLKLANNPDIEVVFNPPAEEYIIHTEVNRVLQVLSNFVNNALKFTSRGIIEIGYEAQQGGVRFYVSDTGIGIPLNKQEEVFKRFIKLNEFANGTGLGLSICASIIKRLNGTIGVISEEEKGSTFWFALPVQLITETSSDQ